MFRGVCAYDGAAEMNEYTALDAFKWTAVMGWDYGFSFFFLFFFFLFSFWF